MQRVKTNFPMYVSLQDTQSRGYLNKLREYLRIKLRKVVV